MAATGTIIAAIIGAGVAIGTAAYQSSEMDKAQAESKSIAGRQEAIADKQWRTSLRLKKAEMAQQAARDAESKRQFDVNTAMAQENNAYTKFENQFGKLANIMSQNQQLEDLFINRLKGLRG